ncbi:helix-hairpin-helix domain-containing protein [Bacillus timonensis]|uniref:helix-hairpin-helix domain-containing protein n=1 Tax=Bacillus timonensis TaxID=1033734 RepID=UPI000288786D|nr:helix-hairpin-helix domain-containing protein [Bacillus timonensis]
MDIKSKKMKLILIVFGVCLGILFAFYTTFLNKTEAKPSIEEDELTFEPVLEEEPAVVEDEPKLILVDIKGAVHNEGVYEARDGMRVKDIVEMAGGFTEDAEQRLVNLAQRIEDEMVIDVPHVGEAMNMGESSISQVDDGMVSLNKATQVELETLTGIGPSKAAAIITYREEHGPFKQLEDLLQVSGIGEKSFEKIKDELKLN